MANSSEIICPSCRAAVPADSFFCPNCGKQLKDKLPATSLSKQMVVYAVSLFLPPFGFWYAWKYLKQPDPPSRKIGITAIILTIISILVTIWFAEGFISSVNQSINSLNNLNF